MNVMEGSGKLELTGNLGDVMKESAHAALSYIRSRAEVLGIPSDFTRTGIFMSISRKGPSPRMARPLALRCALPWFLPSLGPWCGGTLP